MSIDKDEIKNMLSFFSKQMCGVFALRSAMRIMPLLAIKKSSSRNSALNTKAFWYWNEKDIAKYLLALFNSYSHSFEHIIDTNFSIASVAHERSKDSSADILASSHARVADAHMAAAVFDAADVAANAAYACFAFEPDDAAANIEAVSFTADTIEISIDAITGFARTANFSISQEIRHDLTKLSQLSITELLKQPLWSKPIPKNIQQLVSDLKDEMISLNVGFDLWWFWYNDRLLGKSFDLKFLNHFNNIPNQIQQQGVPKLNAYLKTIVHKTAKKSLNQVRVIFIGSGEAGKTSLIRVLFGEEVIEGKEEKTPGIDIRNWSIPNTEIEAIFWDFAGQVMAHSTHQFFLRESCLYVLVINGRSEINGTAQAEYWLEHVKAFGNSAPVMLVGNKVDQAPLNLDLNFLNKTYDNIINFYPLSCKYTKSRYKNNFDGFKQDFCQQLLQVGTHQIQFTEEHFTVMNQLRSYSSKNALIPHQEFESICENNGVTNLGELNRKWLLDILDKLGVIIHFPQLKLLEGYILNPRWLTHGVYTLMNSGHARLPEKKATAILSDKVISDENGNILNYTEKKSHFILEVMQEFKLAYPLIGQSSILIIPELLPSDLPKKVSFEKSGALSFEFKFTSFLPRHIISQLIVSRYDEIVDQTVWQNGVLLCNKKLNTTALLEVKYNHRIINIWVQGHYPKEYLVLLNDELFKIFGCMDLDYEEYIELPISSRIGNDSAKNTVEKVNYRQLLTSIRNGHYVFPGQSCMYDLKKVFKIILSESQITSFHIEQNIEDLTMINQKVKINNSVLNGSIVAARNFENSFNLLKQASIEPNVQILLEQLLTELQKLNEKKSGLSVISDMTLDAETLIKEFHRNEPRKKLFKISLDDLKKAAITTGDIAKPILSTVEKLIHLLC